MNLFNNEIFTANDFRPVENQGVYLNDAAFKNYLRLYEQRMREPVAIPDTPESTTMRDLIKAQVQVMSQGLKTGEIYQPYQARW